MKIVGRTEQQHVNAIHDNLTHKNLIPMIGWRWFATIPIVDEYRVCMTHILSFAEKV